MSEPREFITEQVPAEALRFDTGPCEFGDNGENAKTAPLRMVARSGKPIEHWYWGKVVHDLSGMKLNKSRVPVDYCHYNDEVIGYLSKFEVQDGDLHASGALTPFKEGDRASEVIFKAKAGVPYEASINFGGDGIVIEEVSSSASVEVNGEQFSGPGIVIRQWPLRGVAVCPYGADANTKSELSNGNKVNVKRYKTMSNPTKLNQEAEAQAVETPEVEAEAVEAEERPEEAEQLVQGTEGTERAETPDDGSQAQETAHGAEDPRAECRRFVEAFGADGAKWYADGMTFEQAQAAHTQKLADENARLRRRLAEMSESRGEDAPVESDGGGTATKVFNQGLAGAIESQIRLRR